MGNKKKILFTCTNFSTFVRTDFEILSSNFEVTCYQFLPGKGVFNHLLAFSKQFFYLLFNAHRFDFYFIWFADSHSFLPVLFSKMLNKKSFLVNGGYDVARIREFKYGVFCSRIRGFFAAQSMKNCTLNLPVSNIVARKVKAITHKTNSLTIYNCVNLPGEVLPNSGERDMVLTVGLINTERDYMIKGIDTFADVAWLLPQLPFCIIGLNKEKLDHLIKEFPPNIQVIEKIPHGQLKEYYSKAKIYCQFSRIESFGVALAEAITYGCIPLVTRDGALPELVKDKLFQENREILNMKGKVEFFFNCQKVHGLNHLTDRIKKDYSVEKRREMILQKIAKCGFLPNNSEFR